MCSLIDSYCVLRTRASYQLFLFAYDVNISSFFIMTVGTSEDKICFAENVVDHKNLREIAARIQRRPESGLFSVVVQPIFARPVFS